MTIHPWILGRGMSGQAMALALGALRNTAEFSKQLAEPRFLPRGSIPPASQAGPSPLLLIANPHALHAQALLEADASGYRWMVVEKPICTSLEQLGALSALRARTRVCHGYRQFWGPQRLRQLVSSGELGRTIAIEGRYWQSSAAQKALDPSTRVPSWKNDVALSGPYDVALDLATHWLDLVTFISGVPIAGGRGWRSFVHSEASHRDTHLHLDLPLVGGGRSFASVSKVVHGAGNRLEVQVIGERASAEWSIERPDEVLVGRGGARQIEVRNERDSLGLPSFHGAGWMAGYAAVIRSILLEMLGLPAPSVPTLEESVAMMKGFFAIEWQDECAIREQEVRAQR